MRARATANGRSWLREVPAPEPPSQARPSRPAPTDDEIVEAVARGDEAVAALLYDRLIGVVDRTLVRVFGRREHDHDDLVQATFEQIVLTLSRRRFAGACSLSTWASTVASHVGLNALRSRRRERNVFDRSEVADLVEPRTTERANPERLTDVRESIDRVRSHLLTMEDGRATTLFLHDVLGHDLAEIAVLTGVSVAAAQSRLVRGRKELHARLERDAKRTGGTDGR